MNRTSLAFAVLLVASAHGQVDYEGVILKSPDIGIFNEFARRVDVEDIDADGFDDVIVVEPGGEVGDLPSVGRLWVSYGPVIGDWLKVETRDPVPFERIGFATHETFSELAADVDSDGHIDLIAAAIRWDDVTGRVHVWFGPDWTEEVILVDPVLETGQQFGSGVIARDLDGDGLNEFAIGSPMSTGLSSGVADEGRVWVWGGEQLGRRDFSDPKLLEPPTSGSAEHHGDTLRHHGGGDLWIAMSFAKGDIAVTDYATGASEVIPAPIPSPYLEFGDAVARVDLDGDGEPDLVVGARLSEFDAGGAGFEHLSGAVAVLAGPDFTTPITTIWPPVPSQAEDFGLNTHVVDVDGDGHVDIVVGDEGGFLSEETHVVIAHGPTFDDMQVLDPPDGEHHAGFGHSLAVGDLDGDGLPELLAGAQDGATVGSLTVFSPITLTASADELSVASGGSVGFDVRLGQPSAGVPYVGVVGGSGAGDGAILGHGSWLPFEPDVVSAMGLALLGTPVLDGFEGVLDADGAATLTLDWPAGFAPSLAGTTLSVAVVTFPTGTRPGPCSSRAEVAVVP